MGGLRQFAGPLPGQLTPVQARGDRGAGRRLETVETGAVGKRRRPGDAVFPAAQQFRSEVAGMVGIEAECVAVLHT